MVCWWPGAPVDWLNGGGGGALSSLAASAGAWASGAFLGDAVAAVDEEALPGDVARAG
jgi:hypothetical protein